MQSLVVRYCCAVHMAMEDLPQKNYENKSPSMRWLISLRSPRDVDLRFFNFKVNVDKYAPSIFSAAPPPCALPSPEQCTSPTYVNFDANGVLGNTTLTLDNSVDTSVVSSYLSLSQPCFSHIQKNIPFCPAGQATISN